jgi:GGDEF domain-containing protein/DNA-binding NarL/FixJ family response regulator
VIPFAKELSYVLIADGDRDRTNRCLESLKPQRVGVLVARDAAEALSVLRNFGSPLLLIVDLTLPGGDGFSVVEAARGHHDRTRVLALAPSRELREFAAARLAGRSDVRVVSGSAPAAVIHGAIERLLRMGPLPDVTGPAATVHAGDPADSNDTLTAAMSDLAERALQLCRTAGVTVYMRSTAEEPFRSSTMWTPDEPMPRTLEAIPRALKQIVETGERIVTMEIEGDSARTPEPDAIHGLVAVPIESADARAIVGMIAVFDVRPMALSASTIEALEQLGRHARPERVSDAAAAVVAHAARTAVRPAQLLGRQAGSRAITREMARAKREHRQLSVAMFDVGNELDGASVADPATVEPIDPVAQIAMQLIRAYDFAIRWSASELVIVLPGVNEDAADRVAERVRSACQTDAARTTVATGVAQVQDDRSADAVIVRAHERARRRRQI